MKSKIAVGLCTYLRPQMLKNALNGINNLEFPDNADIVLIVVDNDHEGSAREIVENFKQNTIIQVYYVIESNKGIPFARNRAIKEALALESTEMAFFDDDAVPDKSWLKTLFNFYKSNNSIDVVTGPQVPILPDKSPEYFKARQAYRERKIPKTGSIVHTAATNNVLFSLKLVKEFNLVFDETIGAYGGSDTDFFCRAYSKGIKILWTNEAIVREEIPLSRTRLSWILKRQFRNGQTMTICVIKTTKEKKVLINLLIKIIIQLLGYVLLLPIAWIKGQIVFIDVLEKTVKMTGRTLAFFDIKYEEYKHLHGY